MFQEIALSKLNRDANSIQASTRPGAEIVRSERRSAFLHSETHATRKVEILGKRKRSIDFNITEPQAKNRRMMTSNNLWNSGIFYHMPLPVGHELPFAPIFWGSRGVAAKEFTRLIESGYGTRFFNQKPEEVRRAPFMPTFSSGGVVGPVKFGRLIEFGFGVKTLDEDIHK